MSLWQGSCALKRWRFSQVTVFSLLGFSGFFQLFLGVVVFWGESDQQCKSFCLWLGDICSLGGKVCCHSSGVAGGGTDSLQEHPSLCKQRAHSSGEQLHRRVTELPLAFKTECALEPLAEQLEPGAPWKDCLRAWLTQPPFVFCPAVLLPSEKPTRWGFSSRSPHRRKRAK